MKMIKKKNILSLALCFIMFCSACSCSGPGNSVNNDGDSSWENNIEFVGLHNYNVTDTNKEFIKNGRTDYILVIPTESNSYLRLAQSEFVEFFKKATGIDLIVKKDSELPNQKHANNTQYISLGATSLLKSTDIDYSYELLNQDGFRIVTRDNNIYITGAYDTGTLFGVYGFMRATFNYEIYTYNTIIINENVKNLNLKNYDITDVPDFYERQPSVTSLCKNNQAGLGTDRENFMYRMGYQSVLPGITNATAIEPADNDVGYVFNDELGRAGHTTSIILQESLWKPNHPEWFSTNGSQWCYTAGGDKESFEIMTDLVAASVIHCISDNKATVAYPVTQEDADNWCACDECRKLQQLYGTPMGAIIRFVNRVAEKVDAWMENPENNAQEIMGEWYIKILAYMGTETPPVKKDRQGNWVPVDETVIPNEHIQVMHALIYADHQQSYFSEFNKQFKDKTEGWKALMSQGSLSYMFYDDYVYAPAYFYDTFNFYSADCIKYFANISRDHAYIEGRKSGTTVTAWNNLKAYMSSKLLWDLNQNEQELMEAYFKNVFGPASDTMFQLFNVERMYYYKETLATNSFKRMSNYNRIQLYYNWNLNTMLSWIDLADKALKEIEIYKEIDAELYNRYYYNIEVEAVGLIYTLLEQHSGTLTNNQLKKYVDRIKTDMLRWPDIKGMRVNGTLEAYIGNFNV